MLQNTFKDRKLQAFVPGKQRELFIDKSTVTFHNAETLTGEKAKQFYENILKTSSKKNIFQKNCVKNLKAPQAFVQRTDNRSQSFKNSDLFRLAQNDDITNLKLFFEQNKNVDIDITDDFHWTPLMCAACSGAERALKFLLKNGADPHKSDKLGNTPLKLAKAKNFEKIVRLLENKNTLNFNEMLPINKSSESMYCSICNVNFTIAKSKHESSTLHLFNSKYELPTSYGIPESNKGFQLLLKTGWNKKGGLGPDGKGIKFPIKVKVKKNRSGIGISKVFNTKQPLNKLKFQNKKTVEYCKLQEKNMEKNFRREFT